MMMMMMMIVVMMMTKKKKKNGKNWIEIKCPVTTAKIYKENDLELLYRLDATEKVLCVCMLSRE
jgi:hypothetical protein